MGTRTVRLDEEAETALQEIVNTTGMTISAALKQGLLAYREKARAQASKKPSDFFATYDLGDGGYAIAPARQSKQAVKDAIRKKAKRR